MEAKIQPKQKYQYIGLAYISPWIIGFLIFQLYPLVASLIYSFSSYTIFKPPKFIGFENYINIFTKDPQFLNSLIITVKYVLFAVPAKIAFALLIALILNMNVKFINFFRTVYYLPSILGGSVAIAILWRFLFMREGIVNKILSFLYIRPVDWLGDPGIALYTIAILTVWQFGSSMVIFLAGLKQIPQTLYEAAKIDGATSFQMFFHVTLPLLTPLVFFNLVMQMINAFQEFTAAFVITRGGPMKSTYLYGIMVYDHAFKYFNMGYASALAWILFAIIIALTLLIFKSSPYWVYYEDTGGN
ncbi:MAG: carbohydrate ABC transporter permease [Caldanaerobacter sp.]